jgi:glycosyltransferase involved in cell wall biosynthesis
MKSNSPEFQPMVSVCMITYNHEKYISQAIESVLMQKADFPIELVIGEDYSTDITASIVRKYESERSNIVKARYNNPNLGMIPNFVKTLHECKGKYIALLEGDDYWTDPLKLQKQVNYLDMQKNAIACFHDSIFVNEQSDILLSRKFPQPPTYKNHTESLFGEWFIPTASVLFKNEKRLSFPKWYYLIKNGDLALYFLLSRFGTIDFMNERMSAYRIHPKGSGSSLSNRDLMVSLIYLYKSVNEIEYGDRYKVEMQKAISDLINLTIVNDAVLFDYTVNQANSVLFLSRNTKISVLIKSLIYKLRMQFLAISNRQSRSS